jgi:superfamily I DNA/RNA helicase
VHYENEESEYYDIVTQKTLEKEIKGKSLADPFDAILLDEGQDFQEDMLMVLLNLLKPEGDLVIGLDSYQDLYRRKYSWKSVGIKASGRTRYLKNVYRNTVEIFDTTQRFIGEGPRDNRQLPMLPFDFAFHGDPPEFHKFEDLVGIDDFLVSDLKKCVEEKDYKRSEIAIIYDDKIYGPSRFAYDNRALPMRILNRLNTSGIPAFWVSQDVRSKEMFEITTDRISLISIHSSKGLDFDLVYLVGIDRIRATENTEAALNSLIYVAMTRAKYRLVIPYVEETEFIKKMRDCVST